MLEIFSHAGSFLAMLDEFYLCWPNIFSTGKCMSPPSLVPRPFYARGARWERDKGLVPVVRACVEFYWNPGKIVFFGIF